MRQFRICAQFNNDAWEALEDCATFAEAEKVCRGMIANPRNNCFKNWCIDVFDSKIENFCQHWYEWSEEIKDFILHTK